MKNPWPESKTCFNGHEIRKISNHGSDLVAISCLDQTHFNIVQESTRLRRKSQQS